MTDYYCAPSRQSRIISRLHDASDKDTEMKVTWCTGCRGAVGLWAPRSVGQTTAAVSSRRGIAPEGCFKMILCLPLMLAVTLASVSATLLGPGEFNGIVIFDRWDSCVLSYGSHFIYIPERTKEGLRRWEGKAIELYAFEVYQPMNPGEGRIGKYKVLGLSKVKSKGVHLDGLVLSAAGPSGLQGQPSVEIEICNESAEPISFISSDVGISLLARKTDDSIGSPSDGQSYAAITGATIATRAAFGAKGTRYYFTYSLDKNRLPPRSIQLRPREAWRTAIIFDVPPGEYEFFLGYGRGGRREKSVVSNLVAFDVHEDRTVTGVPIPDR